MSALREDPALTGSGRPAGLSHGRASAQSDAQKGAIPGLGRRRMILQVFAVRRVF